MIKPTKDMYGNRIQTQTTIDAVKVSEESDITVKDVLPHIVVDVPIEIGTSDWVFSSGAGYAYYKEFTAEQILSTDNPVYTLVPATTVVTSEEIEAYNKISMVETLDGKVKVYVTEVPAVQITILLKGIPNRLFEV